MRLLATVERYAPAIGGAERVVQRVAEGLAARGHEVHVLTGGARGGGRARLASTSTACRSAGNEARGIRGDAAAVLDTIERIRPEVLFNYAAQTWATDCCFALLDRRERPAWCWPRAVSRGWVSAATATTSRRCPARLRSYDALVLHSTVYQDWAFARERGRRALFVLPNGADGRPRREGAPRTTDAANRRHGRQPRRHQGSRASSRGRCAGWAGASAGRRDRRAAAARPRRAARLSADVRGPLPQCRRCGSSTDLCPEPFSARSRLPTCSCSPRGWSALRW